MSRLDRFHGAFLIGAVRASIVMIVLAATARRFDETEILAAAACWVVFFAMG